MSGALDYGLGERAAVVTGAGTGIGEAVARTLAAAGASVLIADVHAPSARAVAEPIAAGLSSVFSCLRAEVRAMRAARTGGAIVNTASIFGMLAAGAGCRRRARRWGEAAYSSSHATFTYPDRNGLTSPDSGS